MYKVLLNLKFHQEIYSAAIQIFEVTDGRFIRDFTKNFRPPPQKKKNIYIASAPTHPKITLR